MKQYTVTLLKDLPDIDAGFSFSINEDDLANPHRAFFKSPDESMSDDDYKCLIRTVLECRNKPSWVEIKLDYSKAIPVTCPNCGTFGMFPFDGGKPERRYDSSMAITRYYQTYGLECGCGHKIVTHHVLIKTTD